MNDDEPIYNIGAVARMTDISPVTLRIWERRYNFPEPMRTEGKHRLYSAREVQRLRWVKARLDEGMQIRQAVRALQAAEAAENAVPYTAETEALLPGSEMRIAESAHPYINVLRQRLFDALRAHNTEQADQIFAEGLALYAPESLMIDVIGPLWRDIGLGWEQGQIAIATEHLVTNYLRQYLLTWMRSGPPPYNTPPTVLACAPGEWHDSGLLIFGALLRRRRWPIAYLGQSIPLSEVAGFVQKMQSPAVVLTALTEEPARAMAEWPRWLPEAYSTGRPIVAYGGPIFNERPALRMRTPGLFLGTTFQEGVDTLERLLQEVVQRA